MITDLYIGRMEIFIRKPQNKLDMKANELMIGDWVVAEGDDEYSAPVQVDVLYKDGIFIEGDEMDVIPIPLTPEILEKNGFKHDEIHDVYECSAPNGINVTVGLYDPYYVVIDRVYSDEEGEEYVDTLTDYMKPNESDVINVHDLQHVLRLFCIEKEIVL